MQAATTPQGALGHLGPPRRAAMRSQAAFLNFVAAHRGDGAAPQQGIGAEGAAPPHRDHYWWCRAAESSAQQHQASSDSAPKRVVITGGSKGLGYAMAREFLALGDSVALCGRHEGRLEAALHQLGGEFGTERVHGIPCDCSRPEDMRQLGEFVRQHMCGVDLWVNNAGEVTRKRLLADVDAEEVVRVVGTNVVGSLLGTQQAIRLMQAQLCTEQPAYHIFNMGFSKYGAKLTKSAVTHKATKRALTQITDSLQDELREAGLTSIGVHNLSPGMLLTDLLLRDSTPAARRLFNALAEEPETVAAALVPQMRDVQGSGTSIEYLTPLDALCRIVVGLPQVLRGGRFFDEHGERVRQAGQRYQANGVRVQIQKSVEQPALIE